MAKKKKKQMRETLYCPYCKRPGVLRPAAYVYGDNNLDPEKYLYVCSGYPSCDSYIGAHKKSMRPMGTMADSNLRNKRIEAHRALDAIWKNGYMTKHSTYIWLQNRLNLREKDTHIGKFSYYLCEQTIRECTDYISCLKPWRETGTGMGRQRGFPVLPESSGKTGSGCADRRMYQRGSCIQHYQPVSHGSHGLFTDRTHEAFYGSPFHGKRTEVFTEGF